MDFPMMHISNHINDIFGKVTLYKINNEFLLYHKYGHTLAQESQNLG